MLLDFFQHRETATFGLGTKFNDEKKKKVCPE